MEPTRYALLCDRLAWIGAHRGLRQREDGTLELMRLPCPPQEVDGTGPYEVTLSGLALAPCEGLFIADTDRRRILFRDGLCQRWAVLPPPETRDVFVMPRGLVLTDEALWVADAGAGRVLAFRRPDLRRWRTLDSGLNEPIALAADSQGRLYVVDAAREVLLRFHRDGLPDLAFNAAVAALRVHPRGVTVAADGTVWISDAGLKAQAVLALSADGQVLDRVVVPGWRPRAVAAGPGRLYIADAASGSVWAFEDQGDGQTVRLGIVPDYRGPVSAMAVAQDGTLFIKPGDDEVVHACPLAAFALSGQLEAGPLDAGEQAAWWRVLARAEVPVGARIELECFVAAADAPTPEPQDWVLAPSPDALIETLFEPFPSPGDSATKRYLWLRVTLCLGSAKASPVLHQVQAQTPGEEWIDSLPEVYRENDLPDGFLRRFLALLAGDFAAAEDTLEHLPQRWSPSFAELADLDWLAGWLAFRLPRGLSPEAKRTLLQRVPELYARRGTVAGMLDWIHAYTGAVPRLEEGYRSRRVWQLDVSSVLGFDTGLAAVLPDGMILADPHHLAVSDPPWGCAEPERLVVGGAVVGASRPLERSEIGRSLFDDTAHFFCLHLPHHQAPDSVIVDEVRRVTETEKPAHTDYRLCLVEARMRIGVQSILGIDTVMAGDPPPASLNGVLLGLDSHLDGDPSSMGRIGMRLQLGKETTLD